MALDIIVCILLAITAVYCWKLSRRIAELNEGKEDMEIFVKEFNSAIQRAEAGIAELKKITGETDAELRSHIEKARFLANDLSFLSHKAGGMADRLEEYITLARAADPNPLGLKGSGEPAARPMAWRYPEKPPALQAAKKPVMVQEMSPSKKQAMEAVLTQIAAKRHIAPAKDDLSGVKNYLGSLKPLKAES